MSVTPVQKVKHRCKKCNTSGIGRKDSEKFCRQMISCKAVTKNLYENSEKSFLECEKNGFKKHLPATFLREVFLVQFEINLHL